MPSVASSTVRSQAAGLRGLGRSTLLSLGVVWLVEAMATCTNSAEVRSRSLSGCRLGTHPEAIGRYLIPVRVYRSYDYCQAIGAPSP